MKYRIKPIAQKPFIPFDITFTIETPQEKTILHDVFATRIAESSPFIGDVFNAGNIAVATSGTVPLVNCRELIDSLKKPQPTVSEKHPAPTAIEFLKRSSDGKHRIVSSGDLTQLQISEAQASNLLYVDPDTGLGWALVPWGVSTHNDRQREADYFSRNDMLV